MDRSDFTPEQIEKAKACKTAEDFARLAEEEGVELTDEQMDAIAGGANGNWDPGTEPYPK